MTELSNVVKQAASQAVAAGTAARVAAELGKLASIIAASPRLARALASPDTSPDARKQLLADITRNSFDAESVRLVADVATSQRLSGSAFIAAVTDLFGSFVFSVAESQGNIETVETQLYEFSKVVSANPQLRDALANPGVEDSAKEELVSSLLTGKVEPVVVDLVRLLVVINHGRDVDTGAKDLSYRAGALRGYTVAEVETAIELDANQRQRLTAALSESIGKKIESRFSVNPEIIGSVVVRIGDEVLDGSVRHRLEQARLAVLASPLSRSA